MNTVERIKAICKERKIPIYKLETDCGFGNAYISGLKKGEVRADRLEVIANYLEVSSEYLRTGEEKGEKYSAKYAHLVTLLRNDVEMEDLLLKYYNLSESQKKNALSAFQMIIGGAEWKL